MSTNDLQKARKLLGDSFDEAMQSSYEKLDNWQFQAGLNADDNNCDVSIGIRIIMRHKYPIDYKKDFGDDLYETEGRPLYKNLTKGFKKMPQIRTQESDSENDEDDSVSIFGVKKPSFSQK